MIKEIDPQEIEFNPKTQDWCRLPYPKHPKGCPNYDGAKRGLRGIRPDLRPRMIRECPPTDITINHVFDLSRPVSIIYNVYEVGKDAEQRRLHNPRLTTPGGWYNIRYWQDRARAELYAEAAKFLDAHPDTIVDLCPETHGVNFTKLMRKIGIKLKWGQWPPEHSLDNIVYQICLGGYPGDVKLLTKKGLLGRNN
jgi:hypothetical protein